MSTSNQTKKRWRGRGRKLWIAEGIGVQSLGGFRWFIVVQAHV